MSVERTSSADFFQVEEVRTKLVNPDDLVFVGKLSQFQWAPGHGPDDGIRLLEVEPKRKARGGERRGLISYEVQGMQQPQQTPASRVPRLAESMLGHSIARVPELEASHRPEDGARVCEWEGEKLIVYRARDGQMHAIQMQCPHALAFLVGGEIEDFASLEGCRGAGPFVSCPSHTYVFDVSTGVCVTGPDKSKPARTYLAEADESGCVFVSREPNPPRENTVPLEVGYDIQMRLVERGLGRAFGSRLT